MKQTEENINEQIGKARIGKDFLRIKTRINIKVNKAYKWDDKEMKVFFTTKKP